MGQGDAFQRASTATQYPLFHLLIDDSVMRCVAFHPQGQGCLQTQPARLFTCLPYLDDHSTLLFAAARLAASPFRFLPVAHSPVERLDRVLSIPTHHFAHLTDHRAFPLSIALPISTSTVP